MPPRGGRTFRREIPRPRNLTWAEAAGQPETAAPLRRLPKRLRFPVDFPEPITYDAAGQRLIYRGFLCAASYAYLRGLSPDGEYLRALDEIYQGSSTTLDRPRDVQVWWWVLAGAGLLALAGLGAGLLFR